MSVAPMSRWRKEPILGYILKNDEKKNSVHKGLKVYTKKSMNLSGPTYKRCLYIMPSKRV